MWGEWCPPLDWEWDTAHSIFKFFFEFLSKKCTVLCTFIAKYTYGKIQGEGFNLSLGAENVKRTGLKI